MGGQQAVEALLQFGVYHYLIDKLDVIQVRNQLHALMKYKPDEIDESLFHCHYDTDVPETATEILKALTDDYVSRGHMAEDTVTYRDLFETAVMGILIPRQSKTTALFWLNHKFSPKMATDEFFALCKAANYIQADRIKNDIYWTAESPYGTLELTVNLSKPEKDPKDIEAARSQPASSYPKCLLCLENVGFPGNVSWPARQNLRVIPVTLDDSQWYFQYSPYAYYKEHCIVFSQEHKPMKLTHATFKHLVEFVKQFPHYFLGSNADLPIVGGSILSHEHFQGGRHEFPMDKAETYCRYTNEKYPDVEIGLVKWPMSVIRLRGSLEAEDNILALASDILTAWREYSQGDIAAYSDNQPHNTITSIARIRNGCFKDGKLESGQIELNLVLRNNRTSKKHPLGIFHPHKEWHHVKKENIGLIEVMGLAILPSRLKAEIEEGRISKEEISGIFVNVLKDCGVFKDTDKGRLQFDKFMKSLSCIR